MGRQVAVVLYVVATAEIIWDGTSCTGAVRGFNVRPSSGGKQQSSAAKAGHGQCGCGTTEVDALPSPGSSTGEDAGSSMRRDEATALPLPSRSRPSGAR